MNLSETDFVLFKKWLKSHLRMGSVIVVFTKKDGTERVMKCTTDPTIIMFKDPSSVEAKESTRKINESIMPVYDLEANTWKSFRWDSIKQVRFEL
jgi:hypothetical protein